MAKDTQPVEIVAGSASIGSITVTGSKGTVKTVSLSDATAVLAAGTSVLSSAVPTGKKWTILGWNYLILAPSGSATGTHILAVNVATLIDIARASAVFNKRIQYAFSQWYDGGAGAYMTTTIVPDDHAAQINILRGMQLQNGIDVKFSYTNSTDVTQNNSRTAYLLVLEEDMTS